jgi:hypothetical protein
VYLVNHYTGNNDVFTTRPDFFQINGQRLASLIDDSCFGTKTGYTVGFGLVKMAGAGPNKVRPAI